MSVSLHKSQSRVATTRALVPSAPTPREMVKANAAARIRGYAIRTHLTAEVIARIEQEMGY